VFNPSSVERLSHTLAGAWQAGAWLMVSVGAYYLLKKRHRDFAFASLKIGLIVAVAAALFTAFTGHHSAAGVAKNQPSKLAAFEGLWDTQPHAPLYIAGWVDAKNQTTHGIAIPGALSVVTHGDPAAPVTGLRDIPADERPPINFTFQLYHIMVAVGVALLALALWAGTALWRGKLENSRLLLGCLMLSVLGPQIANQAGWWAAEVGRQPWIVYKLLRTSDALSKVVQANQVLSSIIMFSVIYVLLFGVFIFLLNHKIQHGPDESDLVPTGKLARGGKGGAL
jgi:cytochrome d ubiquinol oxidase subunit I